MAVYFAADHVVWAGQAGLTTDAKKLARWQKVSLWAWFGGSVCTLLQECEEIGVLAATKRPGEPVPEWRARQAKAAAEIDRRILVLVHAGLQVRNGEKREKERRLRTHTRTRARARSLSLTLLSFPSF